MAESRRNPSPPQGDGPSLPEPRGEYSTRTARNVGVALVGIASAALPAWILWGFTVDDALITARYAFHLATGHGYRWNALGPVTDGVTPLGFPFLLAPFARTGPLAALEAARVLGAIAWIASAGVLSLAIDRAALPGCTPTRQRLRWSALLLVACSAPLGAWCSAGMETGLATALATLAVALPLFRASHLAALAAGAAAVLRPELLPWAFALALVRPPEGPPPTAFGTAARIALSAGPFWVVVALRLVLFGRPTPLSLLAKPSDLHHGLLYATACFLLTGPVVLLAPVGFARLAPFARGILLAVIVHFAAVAFAGGDWMPLSRLVVPVLPGVVLVAAYLAQLTGAASLALRLALAASLQVFAWVRVGPAASGVFAARTALARELSGALSGARVIAALDIGWVGGATDATIVDLAGLTDPAIAALPGGHTSKAVGDWLLDSRKVDTLVLLLAEDAEVEAPWTRSRFARAVETRLARAPGIDHAFAPVATSGVPHLHYVVLRRLEAADAP